MIAPISKSISSIGIACLSKPDPEHTLAIVLFQMCGNPLHIPWHSWFNERTKKMKLLKYTNRNTFTKAVIFRETKRYFFPWNYALKIKSYGFISRQQTLDLVCAIHYNLLVKKYHCRLHCWIWGVWKHTSPALVVKVKKGSLFQNKKVWNLDTFFLKQEDGLKGERLLSWIEIIYWTWILLLLDTLEGLLICSKRLDF